MSFACPEHKCTNCQVALGPKGHNPHDCPQMEIAICDECGEPGHSEPIAPFVHAMHVAFEVTEYKPHTNAICSRAECQPCKLFGHVTKDCAYANCLDAEADWLNILKMRKRRRRVLYQGFRPSNLSSNRCIVQQCPVGTNCNISSRSAQINSWK
jgi:hypothetical protein